MSKLAAIVGRILIAVLFIWSGAFKLMDVSATETMIVGAGLPSGLAIPVGIFEIVAGLCIAFGFAIRFVSVILAVYVALTILFFHNRFNDPQVLVEALKNLAIIGGLALAFAHSQMWYHYYALTSARRGERAAQDADARAHEAEIRAARAEAVAEALRSRPAPAGATTAGYEVDGGPSAPVLRRRRWFDW